MSKIEQLIKEKCPNGVKFYKLSEISEKFNGLSGKNKADFENGNYRYISYTNLYNNPSINLETNDYVNIKSNEKQNDIKFKDILIAGSSENLEDSGMVSVVTDKPSEKIYLNSFCFGLRLTPKYFDLYNADFLKHLFRSKIFRSQITRCSFGVTRYNISKDKLLKIKIPCPPIEIQEEIVKILDKFSELEAELEAKLEAELEARKKQYKFWYRRLFEFDNKTYYSLINVCDYVDYRGKTPKKVDNGIFLVTAKNIKMGYIDYECSKEYISTDSYDNVMKRGKPKLGDVLFTTEAPCGHVTQVDNDTIALAQRVIKYSSKNIKVLTNDYLKYVLLSPQFQNRLLKLTNGGTVKGIKGSTLHKMKIPIPPLQEQERIVKILDKFDKLINDISEGIPAEIEARRKQYEFYRNKLLSFKEF